MIKKLKNINSTRKEEQSFFKNYIANGESHFKEDVINEIYAKIAGHKIHTFYDLVGECLVSIGFENVSVTRDGDTNNRMDAIIIDKEYSIPIEIKSPTEVEYINIKSIRQALENKIILLSRNFYKTDRKCTSLAIGYNYPANRSEVDTLINYFFNSYNISIGYIDIRTLLSLRWDKEVLGEPINLNLIRYLKGALK